ncbi:MAG: hypothetical protein ACTIM4_07035 [Marinomonas sp.]|mgnify:CR=1 FL=1
MNHKNFASLAKVTLKVSGITQFKASDFFQQFQYRHGIVFLKIELKKHRILVHYDVLELSLAEIINGIQFSGMALRQGVFYDWRLNLAKQVEKNICDNLNHVPHCCGKAPNKALIMK